MNQSFKVYFTSDVHGYFFSTTYANREDKNRGLLKCANGFKKDGNTLVLDAGDLLQGSAFTYYCQSELKSNKSIAEIVINSKKSKHVDAIFNKITDEETLKWIAIEANDKKYKNYAVDKIDNADILYDLVLKSKDNSIKKAAIQKESFTSEEVLKKVAIEDKDEWVKKAAISKINDENTLSVIAQVEENAKVRS